MLSVKHCHKPQESPENVTACSHFWQQAVGHGGCAVTIRSLEHSAQAQTVLVCPEDAGVFCVLQEVGVVRPHDLWESMHSANDRSTCCVKQPYQACSTSYHT